MISTNEPLPELPDPSSQTSDDILTVEERRKRYRAKLENLQTGKKLRLKQFLLGKRRYFRSLDIIPRRKRAEDTDLMCRYYNGDQYGGYSEIGVYEDNREEGDFAYAIPVLSGHVDQAFLQILKVRPQYTVTANNKDNASHKLVANMCEELGVRELKRVMDPVTHSDIYNMLFGGESYTFIGWAPNKKAPKVAKRPKYISEKVPLPARRECAECKAEVEAGASACPDCGSTAITEIPAGETTRSVMAGYDEVQLGENTVHLPHMLATQRDMSAVEPEESTFLIEYSYIEKHVAEWEYQSEIEPSREPLPVEMLLRFDLERGTTQTDAIIGTSRLAAPGREGQSSSGANGTAAINKKQPQENHYWEPSQYGQFRCDVDETLPNGKVIPAGTLLGDYYPNGMKVRFMGDSIMDVDECITWRKVTVVRYGRVAGTNSGAGLKKIMPLQDALNDDFNLSQTVKHTVGHPLTVIDGHYVNELPGAGNVLKVTRAGLDDVGKVVKQFPGQAVNHSDGAASVIEGAMQFIAGTNTVGGSSITGAPDMRAAGTATGIAAMQEQAAGRQSGPVDQRIMRDMELIIQLLENIQEFSTDEQKEELGRSHGPDIVEAFFRTNLRHTMTVGIKANTDLPRSMALTQANYMAYGQSVAAILPLAAQFPWVMEYVSEMATSMGFPFSTGEGRNDRREAEYRLNLLTAIEKQMIQSQAAPLDDQVQLAAAMHAQLASVCNPLIQANESATPGDPSDIGLPRVFLQVHTAFMDVYKDALFGEQAKGWSDAYKLVVIQLWLDHFKAQAESQVMMAQMQSALNPEAGPDPNDEEADPEEAAKSDHQRQLELRGAEHDASEQAKDADLERKLVEESHKAGNQEKLEGIRQTSRQQQQQATKQ